MKVEKILLSIVISTLLLSGCSKHKDADQNALTSETSVSSNSTNFNEYIEISNQLSGLSGVEHAKELYLKQNIANITSDREIDYPSLNYKYLNEKFAQLKDVSNLSTELNVAGEDLKEKIKVLEKDYNEFNLYYSSGEYKTDKLAKGKAADAAIKQHFEQAVSSFSKYQEVLKVVYEKKKKDQLEQLKASGDQYIYHRAAALYAAERLVNVFGSNEDLQNKEKNKEADALAIELQGELTALNTEYNQRKEKDPSISTDTVLLNLTSCLKYYREFKESRNQSDFKFMVDGYNSAVSSANRG